MPPRGPRSVLCVVEVTKSAMPTGLGYSPAAISPDVGHQQRAHRIRNLAEALPVDRPRIGRRAGDDELGLVDVGKVLRRVVVDDLGFEVEPVGDRPVQLARDVHRTAVRQVAAMLERQPHDGVARRQHRVVDGLVGLRTGMRLDVGIFRAEQLFHALDRERLGLVHEFAAAVIALARIALGVLVGEHRAGGVQDGRTCVILRGDQLDVVFLPLVLADDGRPQFGIGAVGGAGK